MSYDPPSDTEVINRNMDYWGKDICEKLDRIIELLQGRAQAVYHQPQKNILASKGYRVLHVEPGQPTTVVLEQITKESKE